MKDKEPAKEPRPAGDQTTQTQPRSKAKQPKAKPKSQPKEKETQVSKPKARQASKPEKQQASKPAEPKASKPAEQKASKPAEPKASKPAEPKASKPAEPKASKPAEPKASKPAEPKASEPAEPKASKPAEQALKRETPKQAKSKETKSEPKQPACDEPNQPSKLARKSDQQLPEPKQPPCSQAVDAEQLPTSGTTALAHSTSQKGACTAPSPSQVAVATGLPPPPPPPAAPVAAKVLPAAAGLASFATVPALKEVTESEKEASEVWGTFMKSFKKYAAELAAEAQQRAVEANSQADLSQPAFVATALGGFQSDKVCVHFITKGCQKGYRCPGRHPPKSQFARIRADFKRKQCSFGDKCFIQRCLYFHLREENLPDTTALGTVAIAPNASETLEAGSA